MGLSDFIERIPSDKLFIQDVIIDDKSSQIDLLLVGVEGIYVIIVKMFEGTRIYGDCQMTRWNLFKGRVKHHIYSPYLQSKNRIDKLKTFLKDYGDIPCYSIIVMVCDEFEVDLDPSNAEVIIVNELSLLSNAVENISKGKSPFFTEEQKLKVYNYIKDYHMK